MANLWSRNKRGCWRRSLLGFKIGEPLEGDVKAVLTLGGDAEAGDGAVGETGQIHPGDDLLLLQGALQVVLVAQHQQRNARQALITQQLVQLRPRHLHVR